MNVALIFADSYDYTAVYEFGTIVISMNVVRDSSTELLTPLQVRSYFWSVFSRIRTEYGEIRSNFNLKT